MNALLISLSSSYLRLVRRSEQQKQQTADGNNVSNVKNTAVSAERKREGIPGSSPQLKVPFQNNMQTCSRVKLTHFRVFCLFVELTSYNR